MRTLLTALIVCPSIIFSASAAQGWSEAGHKIIASIAFRQLSPAAQEHFAELLKHHPRYSEDFARHMPQEIVTGTATAQNEWLLQQAAIWPDMARGLSEDQKQIYNHPTWHYIDIPTFLTDADRAALEKTLSLNMSLDCPTAPEQGMNAIQAIRLARRSLTGDIQDKGQAAVWICWLLHDIGDLHQPLHSTAMFATGLFPEGDKGGNSIPTQQGFNLHALWDEFLGDWATFAMAHTRAGDLLANQELAQQGLVASKQLDEQAWLDESRQIAQSAVYSPEVLGYLRIQATATNYRTLPPLRLTEDYLTTGVRLATGRVTQAGYRLGAVLQALASE